ncbi:MAG: type pilus assembly PilZ [Herbinix sp.]|nr:type pilus assembly PilZ [Herbinix sp.]
MEERRKAKRLPVTLTLEICNLFKQDQVQVSDLNAPIEVINVSQTGIGFRTKSVLPIGFYFKANINLGTEDTLHSVVEIVRSKEEGDEIIYGCEFVGMADVLSYVIDDYDKKLNEAE